MKLNLKDEPREWRKSALLALGGLALISSIVRWRHHISTEIWLWLLGMLAATAVCAAVRPRWFRGYHLFSMRAGFAFSRIFGRIFLTLFFIVVVTPLGWLLRWAGKDQLQLRRPDPKQTCWQPAKKYGPLDRLF